jgi:hypothetical protein
MIRCALQSTRFVTNTAYLKDARTPRRTVNLFKKQSVASVT